VGRAGYGQHDSGWLSFYDVFRRIGLKEIDQLNGIIQISQNCGWWWPFSGAVILTERPNLIARDTANRLHSATGPALRYPDGWSIFAWHGLRLDARLIEHPETITVAEIEKESNAEMRRAKVEIYGTGRYLLDSGAQEMHRDNFGILYRKNQANDEPLVMVRVCNATPEPDGSLSVEHVLATFGRPAWMVDGLEGRFKEYFIRVPPTMQRAKEAVAWTFSKTEAEYQPNIET
jgi:hypothetical protein